MSDTKILKEYIRAVIEEEGDGGGDGDGGYGDYGYGGGYGGGGGGGMYGYGVSDDFFKDIWNAFVDPLKAAGGAFERLSSDIQKLAGVTSEMIMSAIIPGKIADFEKYDQEEQARLANIKDKYDDVFKRTDAHLFTGDAALMGFLFAPHEYLTTRLFKKSPEVALDAIEGLVGGNPSVLAITTPLKKQLIGLRKYGRMARGPTSPDFNPNESIVKTNPIIEEGIFDSVKKALSKLLNNNTIKKAIENSSIVKQMQRDAEEYVKSWNSQVLDMAKDALELEDTQKLDKLTGGKFTDAVDKAGGPKQEKIVAKLSTASTKKGLKDFYTKEIKKKVKQLPDGENHPLAKHYLNTIKQIEAM